MFTLCYTVLAEFSVIISVLFQLAVVIVVGNVLVAAGQMWIILRSYCVRRKKRYIH